MLCKRRKRADMRPLEAFRKAVTRHNQLKMTKMDIVRPLENMLQDPISRGRGMEEKEQKKSIK